MSASTQSLQTALAGVVAEARLAEARDAVAGVVPRVVAVPANEDEVAAVLAFANREGLAVLPRGGGTQLDLGFPPRAGDILLDLSRLDQVLEYAPHDLTVSVQAGMPLVALQSVLAESRQELALDPLLPRAATIGGIVSANASGPRRLRFGGVRDQLIGVRVVLADGTIAKGGGKVVKNVAGYDLPKLYTGALGTLGVVVAATFRVYPLPSVVGTVLVSASSPEPLCDLAMRILASPLVPTAMDVLSREPRESGYRFAVRFESGVAEAVRDQSETVLTWAREAGLAAHMLEGADEAARWRPGPLDPLLEAEGDSTLALKASVLPSDVANWLDRFEARLAEGAFRGAYHAHAGHGLIEARLTGPADDLIGAVESLREEATGRQGSLIVTSALPDLLARLDPWGPVPALGVMRALKERFDPNATLNPGRFVGGL